MQTDRRLGADGENSSSASPPPTPRASTLTLGPPPAGLSAQPAGTRGLSSPGPACSVPPRACTHPALPAPCAPEGCPPRPCPLCAPRGLSLHRPCPLWHCAPGGLSSPALPALCPRGLSSPGPAALCPRGPALTGPAPAPPAPQRLRHAWVDCSQKHSHGGLARGALAVKGPAGGSRTWQAGRG